VPGPGSATQTIASMPPTTSAKSVLNTLVQANRWRTRFTSTSRGEAHSPSHQATLWLSAAPGAEREFVGGWEPSNKKAEEAAAATCMRALNADAGRAGPVRHTSATGQYDRPPKRVKRPNPSRLLFLLVNAERDELLRLHGAWGADFTDVHHACAWTVLGRSLSGESADVRARWLEANAAAVAGLAAATSAHLVSAGFGPRELANTVHGVAKVYGGGGRHASQARAREAACLLEAAAAPTAAAAVGMAPQELSCSAWAYAKLAHEAPAVFEAVGARSLGLLGGAAGAGTSAASAPPFASLEVGSLLRSFAQAPHPAPGLFLSLAAHALPLARSFDAQAACNSLWAFAAADLSPPPALAFLRECERRVLALCASDAAGGALSSSNQTQLHQWLLWWELELGQASVLAGPLRERCAAAMARGDDAMGHRVSGLQRDVGSGLRRLGLQLEEEVALPQGYSLDYTLTGAAVFFTSSGRNRKMQIAVEVDGPQHYTSSGAPHGASRLKSRQLKALGWTVLCVRYSEWNLLQKDARKEEAFLRALLAPALSAANPAPAPPATKDDSRPAMLVRNALAAAKGPGPPGDSGGAGETCRDGLAVGGSPAEGGSPAGGGSPLAGGSPADGAEDAVGLEAVCAAYAPVDGYAIAREEKKLQREAGLVVDGVQYGEVRRRFKKCRSPELSDPHKKGVQLTRKL